MAIKFQYNKTALNNLSKQLKMRQKPRSRRSLC